MDLRGKTALVTGSTSGIGLAIATELAKSGANVMLNGFDNIEGAKTQVSESGTRVEYHGADLSKPEEIEDMFNAIKRTFGGLDILVNNAGIQHVAPVDAFPVDRWNAVIAINLSAPFHCTRLALPLMKEKGWGRIINIASVHGLVASPEKSAYVAAKHGVVGLTKVTALETAKSGITCNAICPGWVLTPLVQKQIDQRADQRGISQVEAKTGLLSEKQPSGEFVSVAHIAQTVLFICSPAANEMRGSSLVLDGGWSAQ
jgi:3-hydroxybutyrate dehydrogenase